MHRHLADVMIALDESRAALRAAVDGVPASVRGARPGPGRWSVAEILDHLARVERAFAAKVTTALGAARAAGLGAERSAREPLPEDARRRMLLRTERREALPEARPDGLVDAARAWEDLERARDEFRAAALAGDGLALGEVTAPHRLFGRLSVYQWVELTAAHERRHAAQIDELREALGEPVLELSDATLVRGRTRVLEGLSLTIRRGEHTAILGPNGAGKTSLIRMLTLDDRPRPALNGVPPLRIFGRAAWDVTELRTRLGVVTGDLDAGFGRSTSRGRVSGLDTAVSGLLGSHGVFRHHGVTEEMREQGRTALARVEAGHLADKPLSEMSAGERRRVLIARALVTSPDALVLDEPTSGLDLVARHRFMESVRRLAGDGTTLILVTHHVDEIVPEIGRVVLLRDGAVAFDGPPAEALTARLLAAVFGAPVSVERGDGYYHVRVASS